MKKLLILIISIQGLQSCGISKELPIRGSYLTSPYTTTSPKSFTQVWDNVVDVVAQTGIGFTTLDKTNGLLISKEYSFKGLITYETLAGQLADTSAWVVVKSTYYNVTKEYERPDQATGVLTVRIRQVDTGTSININFTNFKVYKPGKSYPTNDYPIKSTGVFERKLADKIK